MSTTFPDSQAIPEGSSRKYVSQLLDMDGNAVQSGQVLSVKFSLRDARSNAVINGRNRVEVRNTNGGTITSAGIFSMVFNELDTVSIGSAKYQKRRAIFEVAFTYGTENHEVFFYVQNLADIPIPLSRQLAGEGLLLGDTPNGALV